MILPVCGKPCASWTNGPDSRCHTRFLLPPGPLPEKTNQGHSDPFSDVILLLSSFPDTPAHPPPSRITACCPAWRSSGPCLRIRCPPTMIGISTKAWGTARSAGMPAAEARGLPRVRKPKALSDIGRAPNRLGVSKYPSSYAQFSVRFLFVKVCRVLMP